MKLIRPAIAILLTTTLTSCGTLMGVMNSLPFRMLDELGTMATGAFAENELPANGAKRSLEQRAKDVETRGLYAGAGRSQTIKASRENVASR